MPKSSLDQEPEAPAIRELHEHIQTDPAWARQRTVDKWLIDHYFDEHGIETLNTKARGRKRKIEPERLSAGLATHFVDAGRSFYAEWPRLSTQPLAERQPGKAEAEKAGIAVNEAWDQLNPPADSPWEDGVWQMLLLGRRVELICPGHTYYYDFPWQEDGEGEEKWKKRAAEWRRKAPLPVIWQNLPAESTFPASLGTVDDQVLSTKTVTWLDLMDMFDEKELGPPPPAKKQRDPLTLGIYANRQWLAYVVLADRKTGGLLGTGILGGYPDRMLRTIRHKLGQCAIRILPGVTTGRREPPYYWRGILHSGMGLLDFVDRQGSVAATSSKMTALPWMKMWKHNDAGEQEGARASIIEGAEGDITFLDPGDPQAGRGREDIEPVYQPEASQQTREFFMWGIEQIRTLTGISTSLEGQLGPSGTAAWAYNWSSETSKARLRPLTKAVIASALDITDMLIRAVVAFGEPISLAKLDEDGQRTGTIVLKPDELERHKPVLAGTYEAKLPINWRADTEIGAGLLVQSIEGTLPIDPAWIADRFFGLDDFWTQLGRWQEAKWMLSDQLQQFELDRILARYEAKVAEEEGMDAEAFAKVQGQLPPLIQQLLQQRLQRGNEATSVSPATRGAQRAGSPGSAAPGGPQPTEEIVR